MQCQARGCDGGPSARSRLPPRVRQRRRLPGNPALGSSTGGKLMHLYVPLRPRGYVLTMCRQCLIGQPYKVFLQCGERLYEHCLHQYAVVMGLTNHRGVVNCVHDCCGKGSIRLVYFCYVDSEKRLANGSCVCEGLSMIKTLLGYQGLQVRCRKRCMGRKSHQRCRIQCSGIPLSLLLVNAISTGYTKGNDRSRKRCNCGDPADRCCLDEKLACGIPNACSNITEEKTPKSESRPRLPLVAESS